MWKLRSYQRDPYAHTCGTFWEDCLHDYSQIASTIKTKFQYPQAREKEGSCAHSFFFFTNRFKHGTSSPLTYIFPCQLNACKVQNFLPWKKVKTSTEIRKTGCNFPKTSDLSPGSCISQAYWKGPIQKSYMMQFLYPLDSCHISSRTKEMLGWWQMNMMGRSSPINKKVVQIQPMLKVKMWESLCRR